MKKHFKKSLALLLSLLMIFTAVPLTAGAEDYIEIRTKEDLNNIRNNLSGNYILMNDIIFNSSDFEYGGAFYNNGDGWMPIGITENNDYFKKLVTSEFTGILDGNGYSVKNLEFDRSTEKHKSNEIPYYGFIAVNNGTIKNLNITVNFTLSHGANGCGFGGICGLNNNTITNCQTYGSMYFEKTYDAGDCAIGGIAGCVRSGTVSCCSNNINISGYNANSFPYINIGGIVGAGLSEKNTVVTISECYNTGNITPFTESRGYLGGILARCDFSGMFYNDYEIKIENCYNTGSIGRGDIEGKIAGITAELSYISVKNCYNVGTITDSEGNSSAIWNTVYTNGKTEYCYCLKDCAENCNGSVLQGKQMMFKDNFAGFDFENTWIVDPSTEYSYPQLRNNLQSTTTPEEHDFSTSEIMKNASCTETGAERFYCSDCDEYFDFIISKLPHEYTTKSVVTAPTCISKGYTAYYCKCGDYYCDDYVDKIEHEYTSEITTPATHLTEGVKTFTCECGDFYTEPVAKLPDHSYTSEVTVPATHLTNGVRTYTCLCGYSYTRPVAKLPGHTYITETTPPTCTINGFTTYTCACGYSYRSDYVYHKGHSYTSEITKMPTHTEYGIKTFTCGNCGDSYTEDIQKIPHHNYVVTEIIAPNCSSEGYAVYTCECGDYYYDDYVDYDYSVHVNEDGDKICDYCGELTEYCSCNCHSTNSFIAFFWKILNFLQRLFGTNPVCECGVAHY